MILNWQHIKQQIFGQQMPVQDDAWQQMEAMLNSHMPVKKKKNALWLMLPVLAGLLGLSLFLHHNFSAKPNLPTQEIKSPALAKPKATPQQQIKAGQKETPVATSTTKTESATVSQNKSSQVLGGIQLRTQQQTAVYLNNMPLVFSMVEMNLPNSLTNQPLDEIPLPLNQNIKPGRWELKVFTAATYTTPNYTRTPVTNYTHVDYESVSPDALKPAWGFDVGVELSYFLNRYIKFSSGIGFREIVMQNNVNHTVDKIPVIDSATQRILAYINTPNAMAVSDFSQNRFSYASVPISLFAELPLADKWSLTGEYKHIFNFIISQQSMVLNPQTLQMERGSKDMFQSTFMNYQALVGVRYKWRPKMSLVLEGGYRGVYGNMLNSNYAVWSPRDMSLNLGLIFILQQNKKTSSHEK